MVCFRKTIVFPKAIFVLVSLIKTDVSLNSSQENLVGKDSTCSTVGPNRNGPVQGKVHKVQVNLLLLRTKHWSLLYLAQVLWVKT